MANKEAPGTGQALWSQGGRLGAEGCKGKRKGDKCEVVGEGGGGGERRTTGRGVQMSSAKKKSPAVAATSITNHVQSKC